ncbi:hypothetical protein DIPPA_16086 [Diplonema papillatum]|nr:hypothetical protein DIPPA_16086 [Diplonema papillatum]
MKDFLAKLSETVLVGAGGLGRLRPPRRSSRPEQAARAAAAPKVASVAASIAAAYAGLGARRPSPSTSPSRANGSGEDDLVLYSMTSGGIELSAKRRTDRVWLARRADRSADPVAVERRVRVDPQHVRQLATFPDARTLAAAKQRICGGTVTVAVGKHADQAADTFGASRSEKVHLAQVPEKGCVAKVSSGEKMCTVCLGSRESVTTGELTQLLRAFRYTLFPTVLACSCRRSVTVDVHLDFEPLHTDDLTPMIPVRQSASLSSEIAIEVPHLTFDTTDVPTAQLSISPDDATDDVAAAEPSPIVQSVLLDREPGLFDFIRPPMSLARTLVTVTVPVVMYTTLRDTTVPLLSVPHNLHCPLPPRETKVGVTSVVTGAFGNGELVVTFTSGYTQHDLVLVNIGGAFTIAGNELRLHQELIGKLVDTPVTGYKASSGMVHKEVHPRALPGSAEVFRVEFESNMSESRVQMLLQQLQYASTGRVPRVGPRVVEVRVTDAWGLTSSLRLMIQVRRGAAKPRLVFDEPKPAFRSCCGNEGADDGSDAAANVLRLCAPTRLLVSANARLEHFGVDRFSNGFLSVRFTNTPAPLAELSLLSSPDQAIGIALRQLQPDPPKLASFCGKPAPEPTSFGEKFSGDPPKHAQDYCGKPVEDPPKLASFSGKPAEGPPEPTSFGEKSSGDPPKHAGDYCADVVQDASHWTEPPREVLYNGAPLGIVYFLQAPEVLPAAAPPPARASVAKAEPAAAHAPPLQAKKSRKEMHHAAAAAAAAAPESPARERAPPPPPCRALRVHFTAAGNARAVAVSELLRSIQYHNPSPCPVSAEPIQLDYHMVVGPPHSLTDVKGNPIHPTTNTFRKPLRTAVSVKCLPPIIKLQANHASTTYMEGDPAVKLGPIDFVVDSELKDLGGYILVEVVEGHEPRDLLAVKEEGGLRISKRAAHAHAGGGGHGGGVSVATKLAVAAKLKLTAPPEQKATAHDPRELCVAIDVDGQRVASEGEALLSPRRDCPAKQSKADRRMQRTGARSVSVLLPRRSSDEAIVDLPVAKSLPSSPRSEADSSFQTLKDRVVSSIRRAAAHNISLRKQAMQEAVLQLAQSMRDVRRGLDARFRKGRAAKAELYWDEHRVNLLIGTLYTSRCGAVLLQLSKKVKKHHITAVLKHLAYCHAGGNPHELLKKVRVTVACPHATASQCIIDLTVVPVDDVTEIVLKQPRLSFRQGTTGCTAVGALCLCPVGSAWLVDPDTANFDGGYVQVEIMAGGVKGDIVWFLTSEQQSKQLEQPVEDPEDEVTREILKRMPTIVLADDPGHPQRKTVRHGTVVIGHAVVSKSKVLQGVHDVRITFLKSAEGAPPLVPLWLASYIINCLTFSHDELDRAREGPREIRISICDPDNAVAGKKSVVLDVLAPFVSLPAESLASDHAPVTPTTPEPGKSHLTAASAIVPARVKAHTRRRGVYSS